MESSQEIIAKPIQERESYGDFITLKLVLNEQHEILRKAFHEPPDFTKWNSTSIGNIS